MRQAGDRMSINSNGLLRRDALPERGGLTAHLDSTLGDPLLYLASRSNTGAREDFL